MSSALTTSIPWLSSLPAGLSLTGKVLTTKSSTTTYILQAKDGEAGDSFSLSVTVEPQDSTYNYDSVFTRVYKEGDEDAKHTVINSLHCEMSSEMPQECTISIGGEESTQVAYTAGGTDSVLPRSFVDVPVVITAGMEYITGSPSTSITASITSDLSTGKETRGSAADAGITSAPTSTANPTASVNESTTTSGALSSPRNVLRSIALSAVAILVVSL